MNQYEKQIRTIMRCLAAESEQERELARAELRQMLGKAYLPVPADIDGIISNTLLELAVPDHLRGHAMLTEAIKLAVVDPEWLKGITTRLYPQVAEALQTTPARVERGIRFAIEIAWERMEYNTSQKYFGNIVSSNRGNPSNAEFIARVTNVVRQQMKEGS